MADEVEKIEAKLVQKISFSYTSPYPGALSWCCDDRISVVTDQCVYVITLLFSEEVVKSGLKYYLSCVPVKQECFMIETGDINNYDLSKAACTNLVKRLLDPIANPSRISGVNLTSYRSAVWSPSGCDSYGRSIIATLCLDHRLSLYTSNKIDKDWKEVFCISDIWHSKCKAILGSDPKFKSFKKRKGCPQSKMPVGEFIAKSELEMVYIDKVALTCLDWCPVLLGSQEQKYALLTAVTKSGNITFWKVGVPCSAGGMADVELIDGDIQTDVPLPCSVAWFSRDDLEVSGLLAVGGSNGQIEVMTLKVSKVSESNLSINIPSKHMLWTDRDDLAVNRLQWTYTSEDQSSFATLLASKGSAVVQFSIPLSDEERVQESDHHLHDGIHSAFVTGLDVGQDGRVFTCDSDGVLQMIDGSAKVITHGQCRPSHMCNGIAVSPNGLYIALVHTPNITRLQVNKGRNDSQVEVSILSIFSEGFLSKIITHSSLGSLWDVQTAICHQYSQNDLPKKGPLLEFLNQPLDSIPLLSLYLRRRLVDQLSKNTDSDGLTMEVDEESITEQDWKLQDIQTGRQIVKRLLVSSLNLWLQNYKECEHTEKALTSLLVMSDWLVLNYSDQDSLDMAVQVYNTTGNVESATLASSIREERSGKNENGLMDPLKPERIEKEDTERKSSNELPSREKCQICQQHIPLTSLIGGQCANGHAWKRCLVTFCVCADYLYNRCQDCSGCISLIGQEQSLWLQKLLSETQICSLCHGWKDSRV